MKLQTIIIGAGVSGLLLADELSKSGVDSFILEKSRGVGGRMATKRIQDFSFDQGAPFFTARDPRFVEKVNDWKRQEVVEAWNFSSLDCWRGSPTMNAVAKYLAQGKTVRRECKVSTISQNQEGWVLKTDEGEFIECGRLLITVPIPQALVLLKSERALLNSEVLERLEEVQYEPCLAGCFLLRGGSEIPETGVVEKDDFFSWISDQTAQEGKDRLHSKIVVHAPGDWSLKNYAMPEEELLAIFENRLKPWIGNGMILEKRLHRWKFARVINPYSELFYLNREGTLGMAGDGFGGAKVEGAALSGMALARAIVENRE